MPEILLRRIGRTMLPINRDAEDKLAKIPEGRIVKAKISLRRSAPAHRMFFAVIAAAAQHWPHGVEPEPEGDAELLRAWLLIRAGHCDKIDFHWPDDEVQQQMTTASIANLIGRLRNGGQYPFIRQGEATIEIDGKPQRCPVVRIFISRSMDYETLDEAAFGRIRKHSYDDIEAIVGVRVDDLAREAETA